ncbi:MAG: TetR/AcrR family transcriptional regulator [Rudaea sp.]|nr:MULTISPECIES: TetR/AcrR family transcriptional regulator [unclassified Rudaea]MBN8886993.1 TetR/AcrR family transcriptional regulator [Rudaea sp.]
MNVKRRKATTPPVASTPDGRRPYHSAVRAEAADATRARIIEAARALLSGGSGKPAFSIDGVAREAGVTRLTVYNRFESRLGLLEAVFDDVAERGGLLTDLPAAFAESDPHAALHRLVAVFCRFWARHDALMPTFHAVTKIDEEIAASLSQRSERRRHGLGVLVARLVPNAGKARQADLVDVLFALTGFEMFEALSVRNRGAKAVEALIQTLVAEAVRALAEN